MLWWCVACCIYVWTLKVPSDHRSSWSSLCRWGWGNSSTQADSCVLTFEKPNTKSAMKHETCMWRGEKKKVQEREREREICAHKKRENNEGNAPHPARWGGWVSKLAPSHSSFFLFCVHSAASESAFSWALAQINHLRKSVSNMRVSCECRKRLSTQSKLVWSPPWSYCNSCPSMPASGPAAPLTPF